jgi:hypothetical protein
MHRYAQITVYDQTVRVRVNPDESADSAMQRARSLYLAKQYGVGSRMHIRYLESWNEDGDRYYRGEVSGPIVNGECTIRGVEYWCERAGTDAANRAAIVAAGGFDPLSQAA